jgi:hypothetical protein
MVHSRFILVLSLLTLEGIPEIIWDQNEGERSSDANLDSEQHPDELVRDTNDAYSSSRPTTPPNNTSFRFYSEVRPGSGLSYATRGSQYSVPSTNEEQVAEQKLGRSPQYTNEDMRMPLSGPAQHAITRDPVNLYPG